MRISLPMRWRQLRDWSLACSALGPRQTFSAQLQQVSDPFSKVQQDAAKGDLLAYGLVTQAYVERPTPFVRALEREVVR